MLAVVVLVLVVFSFSHKLEEERERLCLWLVGFFSFAFGLNMLKSFGFLQLQPMSTETALRRIFLLLVAIAER